VVVVTLTEVPSETAPTDGLGTGHGTAACTGYATGLSVGYGYEDGSGYGYGPGSGWGYYNGTGWGKRTRGRRRGDDDDWTEW